MTLLCTVFAATRAMVLVRAFASLLLTIQAASALRIGNYPQYRFNATQLPFDTYMDVYKRVFSRYELTAFNGLENMKEFDILFDMLKQTNSNYKMYVSPLLDHPLNLWPELFGFFYRSDVVSLSEFVRDQPTGILSTKVHDKLTEREFVLSVVHFPRVDVLNELNRLPETYERISKNYGLQNVLFTGDFNTLSPFLMEQAYETSMVNQDPRFRWYTTYHDDTLALSNWHSSLARYLAAGDQMADWILEGSEKILNMETFFNLTELEVCGISGIYPVELELIESIPEHKQRKLE